MDRKIFFSSEIVEFGQFSGKTKLHWREKLLAVPHLATDLLGFPCTFKKMRFASKLRLMHSKTKVGNMPLFLDNLAPDNVTDFTADFRRCLQMLKSSTRLNSLAHCSSVVRPFIRKHTHTTESTHSSSRRNGKQSFCPSFRKCALIQMHLRLISLSHLFSALSIAQKAKTHERNANRTITIVSASHETIK